MDSRSSERHRNYILVGASFFRAVLEVPRCAQQNGVERRIAASRKLTLHIQNPEGVKASKSALET